MEEVVETALLQLGIKFTIFPAGAEAPSPRSFFLRNGGELEGQGEVQHG